MISDIPFYWAPQPSLESGDQIQKRANSQGIQITQSSQHSYALGAKVEILYIVGSLRTAGKVASQHHCPELLVLRLLRGSPRSIPRPYITNIPSFIPYIARWPLRSSYKSGGSLAQGSSQRP